MLECYFCKVQVENEDAAIDADWLPSFWDGDADLMQPCCAECAKTKVRMAPDGEWEMVPEAK